MTAYRPAPSVARIAGDLIVAHHPELVDCEIRFVFRDRAAKDHGRAVWGKARKVSGLNAYLAQADVNETGTEAEGDVDFFVVEIAENIWKILDDRQRIALVDHELCHLLLVDDDNGDLQLKLRAHDVEEFRVVIERHGMWRPEIEAFAATVEQLTLDNAWSTVSGDVES